MYPDLRVVFSTSSLFNILNVNPSVVFPMRCKDSHIGR